MTARTSGAIALRPTGNIQGTHFFLNVSSGRHVARNNWMALPMPNEIIHAMHRLAAACKKYKGIAFTNSTGKIIDNNSPEIETETEEITGVGNTTYQISSMTYQISSTGVGNATESIDSTGVHMNNSTGVHMNNTTSNENENINITGVGVTHDDMSNHELEEMGELPVPALQEMHTAQETEESNDDMYVTPTRQELETLEEMNATNMHHNTEPTIEHVGTDSGRVHRGGQ